MDPGSNNSYIKGEDLGYSTDCQPGVVLYKKVELGQQFCSCIHFVVVSFNILICILSIFVVVYLELVEASNIRSHLHFVVVYMLRKLKHP